MVWCSCVVQLRQPAFTIIPRHIGVIPAQPTELIATGRNLWIGKEIVARDQNGLFEADEVNGHDSIGFFAVTLSIVFPYGD